MNKLKNNCKWCFNSNTSVYKTNDKTDDPNNFVIYCKDCKKYTNIQHKYCKICNNSFIIDSKMIFDISEYKKSHVIDYICSECNFFHTYCDHKWTLDEKYNKYCTRCNTMKRSKSMESFCDPNPEFSYK